MAGIKHILVIRLSAMGDVAMTVPVLRALALQHPEVKLTVLSRGFFKPFFEGIPNISFYEADVNGKHKGFGGLFKLYRELKKLDIDAVADLHNVLRSKIVTRLFALSGKKTATTDKARKEKKALTRAENKIFKPLTPIVQRHAETFRQLGFTIDMSVPVFPEKQSLTQDVLAVTGAKTEKWIGIAPFAQHEGKVYPEDLMQEVINLLAQNKANKIFLFGGGTKEIEVLNRFANTISNVVVVAGKLKLTQELQLISNLDVMLSMDSGNAHMAAMLGVNTVTLWGATHPYAGFAPFNQPEENLLVSDREKYPLLPTSIYGNKKVEGYEDVMRTIAPEGVVKRINEILNK
ncbi:glycosyltransferase family 9 protein [Flavobacterium beibuense]|uniref:ADP-heptose:LPS heptosyltransferase n=1 Tax=Flavobacterium beibuense TaxID=657326 RepID=A0A444WDI5_9FLAO|nr:glycosyltransferase family 9 protein [Flavobacterium beibuense]RYJ43903.1 ADP-heptose:LPS heptosyltransferase [Flavobacterium beibuense]